MARPRADGWLIAGAALLGGAALAGGLYVAHAGGGPPKPRDERALVLQARADMEAQRWEAAAAGYASAIAAGRKVARDAGVWVEHAEALGMLQGGSLRGEPERLIRHALQLEHAHPRALELAGSAAWESGDYASAAQHWRRLAERLQPDDPRGAQLAEAIRNAEKKARFALR